ncbi:hypothetical protein N7539_002679 [Penicillium diatomitis]|uniref:Uncharacterized protein n=1 Tax=Penicillium diatomitis TaxID=2819901 RepID=A0A9X0BZF4_9EURO|nr:uncharacterized protein N7539_002679 [Penicillium diatomitis]KAJ5491112.1 hypothetical protein N7539_002679 [Penicillium diatomitis]
MTEKWDGSGTLELEVLAYYGMFGLDFVIVASFRGWSTEIGPLAQIDRRVRCAEDLLDGEVVRARKRMKQHERKTANARLLCVAVLAAGQSNDDEEMLIP